MASDLMLRHYSDEPIGALRSVEQDPGFQYKPNGLWVSVDSCEDNWRAWCEANTFQQHRFAVAHDVTLHPNARILRLSRMGDLLAFTQTYRGPREHPQRDYPSISWAHVAAEYQGIIITPYVWPARLDDRVHWYYGWDCASGCIWDADAIARVTVAQPSEQAA